MERKGFMRGLRDLALALSVCALMAGPSFALDVYLAAQQFNKTINLPGGGTVSVPMWGFAECTVGHASCLPPDVPGPTITLSPADGTLHIHLRNDLTTEGVSVVIPGQKAALSPVRFTDAHSPARLRVRSFTSEVDPAATDTYSWTGLKPGTYLYHSGTHAAVQVQMGLYGAMKKDHSPGNVAYPGKAYDNELVLVYSEIDPDLHAAVAGGTYGTTGPTSTFNYKPQHFLVNGQPYAVGQAALAAGNVGDDTLIRFLNAGLKTHVPVLQGSHMSLIAEDGNAYTYPRKNYSVLLPAGKTIDALWTPTANGLYPLYDRALQLTTAGATGGGMLRVLNVGGGGGPVNAPPLVAAGSDQTITLPASASLDGTVTDADGLLVPVTTLWTQTSVGGTTTFGVATAVDTTATFSAAGTYVLRLTADDGEYTPFGEVTITVNPAPGPPVQLYFSTLADSAVPGVAAPYDDADIYSWNGTIFSRVFDGSAAGLAGNADIDAFMVVSNNKFYMSFAANGGTTVPAPVGSVQDEDVVLYDNGVWSLYFDGSDVGLDTSNDEDVDAFDILADLSVIVSTVGTVSVPGVTTGAGTDDSDMLRCVGTFGPTTTCTWSVYFDGSDIALAAGSEDVDGVAVTGTTIYLSTTGAFAMPSVLSGGGEDVFACNGAGTGPVTTCTSRTMYFDGSAAGLTIANDVDAIDVP
jgi:FtsP/CotA-like multicopper oxidase with cupredoxin domain